MKEEATTIAATAEAGGEEAAVGISIASRAEADHEMRPGMHDTDSVQGPEIATTEEADTTTKNMITTGTKTAAAAMTKDQDHPIPENTQIPNPMKPETTHQSH